MIDLLGSGKIFGLGSKMCVLGKCKPKITFFLCQALCLETECFKVVHRRVEGLMNLIEYALNA